MSTTDRVIAVIAQQLSIKPELIKPESNLIDDLGADSLDVVELSMGLEEEFDLTIPDEQAEHMLTVGDLIAYLDSASAPTPAA